MEQGQRLGTFMPHKRPFLGHFILLGSQIPPERIVWFVGLEDKKRR
jgi:hypothetical protein